MSGVSVLILTKNEEDNLPKCIESVLGWCDDIHVYDSLSTDRTVDIASRCGAHVTSREFDNWASHQNWGIENIAFKHEWVLYLDADERVTMRLAMAILDAVEAPGECVAFEFRRRDFYRGKWLKHVQASPFYVRLFRPDHVRYERMVNPVTMVRGKTGRIDGYLDHEPFSKGITQWVARHNSYSSFEADQLIINLEKEEKFSLLKAVTARDFQIRRYHQKGLFGKLPFRPLFKFFLLYLVRRGFLDGGPGFSYAVLQSIYEYFIILKMREQLRAKNGPQPAGIDAEQAVRGGAQR